MSDDTLETGRRLARRRMAWASFLFLLATGAATVGKLVLSEDPGPFAQALSTASAPLTGLMTVFTTVVLGYFGASATEAALKRRGG